MGLSSIEWAAQLVTDVTELWIPGTQAVLPKL